MDHCPAPETLAQLLTSEMEASLLEQLEEHLENCPDCQHRLDEMTNASNPFQRQESESNAAVDGQPVTPTVPPPSEPSVFNEQFRQRLKDHFAAHFSGDFGAAPRFDLPAQPAVGSADNFPSLGPPQHLDDLGQFDRFRILRILGKGGMGVVLHAFDTGMLNSPVALKLMRPEMAAVPRQRKRFLREARAMRAVRHPCVIPVYEAGEVDGTPYLVMPLLPGEDLHRRLRSDPPLSLGEILRIALGVAQGLAAAHDAGLIHRDIKPSNVWLEPLQGQFPQVLVLDFGLARGHLSDDTSLSQFGIVTGTLEYMSPEQAGGKSIDPRTDLYGLGCVLYRMVTGQVPFPSEGEPLMSLLDKLEESPPLDVRKWVPQLPNRLGDLIMQLLAKRPEDRPPSAREVVTVVESLISELPAEVQARRFRGGIDPSGNAETRSGRPHSASASTTTSSAKPSDPPQKRRPIAPWVIGLLLFGAIVVGSVLLSKPVDSKRAGEKLPFSKRAPTPADKP